MAGESNSSMDYAYVDRRVTELRGEMVAELRDIRGDLVVLRAWAESEVQRLEDEMKQVGEMIVGAIHIQTAAVVTGVAATTAMMERTKRQIEEEFARTLVKLDTQTESMLQIEVGKKVADAHALKGKLDAFFGDVKLRFDKSILGVALNRELYNVNFRKITDEYAGKVQAIGDHIFQIRNEDIAPAVRAAAVSYEMAHGLPIEMDLRRLAMRSESLDETLDLLKSSRLDEVLSSLDTLGAALDRFATSAALPGAAVNLCVEGIATSSPMSTRVQAGLVASPVSGDKGVDLSLKESTLAPFNSAGGAEQAQVLAQLTKSTFRALRTAEVSELRSAAKGLQDRKLISEDALALFEDFVSSGNLKYLEA